MTLVTFLEGHRVVRSRKTGFFSGIFAKQKKTGQLVITQFNLTWF